MFGSIQGGDDKGNGNRNNNSKAVVDVDSIPPSKNIKVSEGIANVPPIVEELGDQNKETTQSNSNNADINPNEVVRSNVEE